MGAIQNIGAFSGGLVSGANAGMDIYGKYQQIQDTKTKQEQQKAVEAKVKEMAANGGMDDPIQFSNDLSNIYFEQGVPDEGVKYYQLAQQFRKAKAEPLALQAVGIGDKNPEAMINLMNQYHQIMGDGTSLQLTPGPGGSGYGLNIKAAGQSSSEQFGTPEELHNWAMEYLKPTLFGSFKDFSEAEREGGKAQAEIGLREQQTEESKTLTPLRAQTEAAQAGAYGASARANVAQGKYYGAQTDKAEAEAQFAGPKAQAELGEIGAHTRLLQKQTEQAGTTPEPSLMGALQNTVQGYQALPNQATPPEKDMSVLAPIASGLQSANPGISTTETTGLTMDLIRQSGNVKWIKGTNQVQMPNGEVYDLGAQGMRTMAQLMAQKAGAAAGVGK